MLTSLVLVAATLTAAVVTGGEEGEEHAAEPGARPHQPRDEFWPSPLTPAARSGSIRHAPQCSPAALPSG